MTMYKFNNNALHEMAKKTRVSEDGGGGAPTVAVCFCLCKHIFYVVNLTKKLNIFNGTIKHKIYTTSNRNESNF